MALTKMREHLLARHVRQLQIEEHHVGRNVVTSRSASDPDIATSA
jgi:hypothetical protein